MTTLAELLAARDALLKARVGGLREVRDSTGESVTYKTDREMAAALAALDSEIAAATTGRARPAVIRCHTSKGL